MKNKLLFILLLLLLKYSNSNGQWKLVLDSDTLFKKVMLIKGQEYVRKGIWPLNDFLCYLREGSEFKCDTIYLFSNRIDNKILYLKYTWSVKTSYECIHGEYKPLTIQPLFSIFQDIFIAVERDINSKIYRVKGFDNLDHQELILEEKRLGNILSKRNIKNSLIDIGK